MNRRELAQAFLERPRSSRRFFFDRAAGFKSQASTQRFLACHSAVYNTFNTPPHLISRPSLRILRARAERAWEAATVAA